MADEEKEEIRCVRCNHLAGENEKFCTQCGAPLFNHCTDEAGLVSKGCGKKNPPNAAYCAYCGEPTTFLKEGLVGGFQRSGSNSHGPGPFMNSNQRYY